MPAQPPSEPQRPYWTVGRIVGLILIILIAISATSAGVYYGTNIFRSSSQSCANGATNYGSCNTCASGQSLVSNVCVANCGNGATNPTACNVCPSNQTYSSGTCYNSCTNGASNPPSCNNNVCSNGATNYPACNVCPSGQTYSGGSCYNNCTNGATNPPACNNNVCQNGATNYPACTIFTTTTTFNCNPSTVQVNYTETICTATISDTTIPTGMVGFSCTTRPGHTYCDASGPSNTCTLAGVSAQAASCIFTETATGPEATESFCANYQGDATHLSSSGCTDITVLPPPSDVIVSGSVSTVGAGTHPVKIEFVASTGVSYSAVPSSGSYTITLPNFQTYNVLIDWNGALGSSGTCSAGTLSLKSYADTWSANYSC